MPSNPNAPVRRGQLIVPFGTGAMVNAPGGTSLVISGLSHWFEQQNSGKVIDENEFKIEEWRLQRLLRVNHFRSPPDYREAFRYLSNIPNSRITIPAFRFPRWHYCPFCRLMSKRTPYERGVRGKIECEECKKTGRSAPIVQVPFVAICERGHLNEFPWREWVHRSVHPTCKGSLRLVSYGSAMLAGQRVKCDECKKERSLAGITNASESSSSTTLSKTLDKEEEYLCPGEQPWFGPDVIDKCNSTIRGSLKSASNVYFAEVRSSIYLPSSSKSEVEDILPILENPIISELVSKLSKLGDPQIIGTLRGLQGPALRQFTDGDIAVAIDIFLEKNNEKGSIDLDRETLEKTYLEFRIEEYEVLKTEKNDKLLKIKEGKLSDYSKTFNRYFSKIMLIDKLRETRVLSGFSRVFAENDQSVAEKKMLLWNDSKKTSYWLPASVVYGEGIFLEIDRELIRNWEQKVNVISRIKTLVARYAISAEKRKLRSRELGPRFVLVHTLAHVLINRLIFECGYSSAALRERIFVSGDPKNPMAGLLIYTADGDAEGTMGGLVRMGKPGNIERVFAEAIDQAKWCSADPVCMEMGTISGQGPDSCNLAACHNCAHIPETACEEFNRFLDRGLLVGDSTQDELGFFS